MRTHNLIHRSSELHRNAGTFYHYHYGDAHRVFSLFDAYCWMGQLVLEEALDAAKLFYRKQIPPLHRDLFFPVTVSESDYVEGRHRAFHYGDEGLKYGASLNYGRLDNDIAGSVPLPDGISDVDLCTDIPVKPSVILLKGFDFEVKNNCLVFYRNLFDLLPAEGIAPTRTCTFYLRSAYSDRNYIQDRLGVLTRTRCPSTKGYLDFCNLIVDSVIEGTAAVRLTQIICQLFDVPCTQETEVVEVIEPSGEEVCLVTDKRSYFATKAATFLYGIGEALPPGTILTDAISILCHKKLPDGVPLFLERRFLGQEYLAGLFFPNEEFRVTQNTDMSKAFFPVIGRQEDVDRFWSAFHERVLDPNLPRQVSLGGWLNPAEFIYENLLYPRVRQYRVDISKTGENRLPMVNTRILRSLVPPGVLFSLQLEMPFVADIDEGITVRGKADSQRLGMKPVVCPMPVLEGSLTMRGC